MRELLQVGKAFGIVPFSDCGYFTILLLETICLITKPK